MRDTLTIECLMEAFSRYFEVCTAEREARSRYDGPSWDYFGRSYIAAKEAAAEEFQQRVDAYIDARIEAFRR